MFGHTMTTPPAATLPRTAVAAPATGSLSDDLGSWSHAKGMRASVARDDNLFNEGDEARSCYRIVSGAVRVVKIMADGRRYVVDFFLPGDFVGLDGTGSYEFTAEAIVDS